MTQHHAGIAVNPLCSIRVLGMCCLEPALCRCQEGRISGPSQRAVPVRTYAVGIPTGQRHRLCARACAQTTAAAAAAPDYNTSNSSSFMSVVPSPGAYLRRRANPTLAEGRTCSFQAHTCAATAVRTYQYTTKLVSIRLCNTMLALILIPRLSLHFRTEV